MSLIKDKIELELEVAEYKAQQTLLNFPPVLRWVLIICLLAIIPGYFIAKKISYTYWSKTYAQYLIASKPSFTNPQNPVVGDTTILSLGKDVYGAATLITNPNLDLSLPETSYDFIFYNSKNEQIYKESEKLFLLPDQRKYIVVPRFASKDPVTKTEMVFKDELRWQKKTTIRNIKLTTIVERKFNQISPPAFITEGNYYNPTSFQISKIRLTFLVYNNANKLVAVSRRDDFSISPYERRSFKQLWPNLYIDDKNSKVVVMAETDVLNSANITTDSPAPGSSSSLERPSGGQGE